MGMEIILNNPDRSYFVGEVVDGQVVIRNRRPNQVKEITIWLEGTGLVNWVVPMSFNPGTIDIDNDNERNNEHNVFYHNTVAVDGDTLITLPDGELVYPFHFVLPKNIPSSIDNIPNNPTCRISYILKAEIRRSYYKKNDKAKIPITVNGTLNLNLKPSVRQPLECQLKKGTNVFQLRMGEVSCVLRLPTRCGFVPGEKMDFRVEVNNQSNQKVYRMTASLRQVISLYSPDSLQKSTSGIKYVKNTISVVEGPEEVNEGEVKVWADTMLIPPLPPSSLGVTCHIADLDYFLHVEVHMTGFKNTFSGELPVMIGTIPLRSTMGSFSSASDDDDDRATPSSSSRLENALPDYPDLAPPSYAEAVVRNPSLGNPGESNSESDDDNVRRGKEDHLGSGSSTGSTSLVREFVPRHGSYK